MQRSTLTAWLAMALLFPAAPTAAQQVAAPDTLTPVTAPIPSEAPVPRNAFIKALLIPGWGHFSMGETRRGLVYVGLQGTSWAMLGKTIHGLNQVRDLDRGLTAAAADSLAVAMAADTALARELESPTAYEAALLTYPGLQDARNLERSRRRHRQDWIVYTLFFTFAAAVDAYVTAHLSDFPAEITADRSSDNGLSVGVRLPAGRSR
ncbi:MAG TPA: DUF5683 domain-containing protein [Longimicrobiales bacterium]|nr:DUF5683 domain-containing protein [Longimicrobiales bacterium]